MPKDQPGGSAENLFANCCELFSITFLPTILLFFVCTIYSWLCFDLGLIGLIFCLLYLGLGLFSSLLFSYLPEHLG